MEQAAEPILETQPVPTALFAGFWRRVMALFADGIILGLLGLPLGLLLGERLAPVGSPARLVGLLVILPYLGLLGSRVGGGQTLGKRLLGLRVVDATGQPLPVARSFARASLLALPWIFNGIQFGSLGPVVMATLWVAGLLIFGVGGAIVGAFLLNRPTRQALHDLLVGSYVVDAEGLGLTVPARSSRRPLIASAVWMSVVAMTTTAMLAKGPDLMADQFPTVLLENLSAIPGVSSCGLSNTTSWGAGRSAKSISAVLYFHGPPDDTQKAAQEAAAVMLQQHPRATTSDRLVVTVVRGWDVGIFSMTSAQSYVQTPAQWRAALGL